MAAREGFEASGIGEHLLVDALKRVLRHAEQIATAAVVVDVKKRERTDVLS